MQFAVIFPCRVEPGLVVYIYSHTADSQITTSTITAHYVEARNGVGRWVHGLEQPTGDASVEKTVLDLALRCWIALVGRG